MKRKKVLYSIIFLIIFFIIFFIFMINVKDHSYNNIKPYYNITYVGDNGNACLTFINKKEYSMYDCDSEPTNYFFDSEAECSYKITGDEIIFDCKYDIYNTKLKKIKVTNWTNSEFTFIYNGEEKTFKAEN